ncbi:histidine phosphatase family protein [Gordonia insulae]|uniref:Phosphoserine phosphatase 1 n=1 Tax=Gordonia insulae TaxID=2420509 RepID=A0A3G8JIV0_9ACTN|nr:histidine phosphatase family protein [Gordonia insulae]AZG44868.1 hypothetical protein D7316_01460 [Gordonia insulae]
MHIVTAGRTGPNRSVRFGGDLSLDDAGRRTVSALAATLVDVPTRGAVPCGPEAAARESCDLLGRAFTVDPRLRTLDVGAWSGRTPEDLAPDELAVWFTDPTACPHGGETIADFVARIHRWGTEHASSAVCVVSMPVAQALLAARADEFFAVEVRPATAYRMTPGAAVPAVKGTKTRLRT